LLTGPVNVLSGWLAGPGDKLARTGNAAADIAILFWQFARWHVISRAIQVLPIKNSWLFAAC
jgi:hypothetical protein